MTECRGPKTNKFVAGHFFVPVHIHAFEHRGDLFRHRSRYRSSIRLFFRRQGVAPARLFRIAALLDRSQALAPVFVGLRAEPELEQAAFGYLFLVDPAAFRSA